MADCNSSLTAEEKLEVFMTWLRENGAQFPKILFPSTNTVSGIRGAIAIETIETDEVMMEIPFKLLMCEIHALRDPIIGELLARNNHIIQGDTLLAVYIMYEFLKGSNSFYWPVLDILPPPGTISDWELGELDELQVCIFDSESLVNGS